MLYNLTTIKYAILFELNNKLLEMIFYFSHFSGEKIDGNIEIFPGEVASIWARTNSQISKFSHQHSWSLETSLQVASVKPTILQGVIRGDVPGSTCQDSLCSYH